MNDKIKEILNVITANGMRELTEDRLNQFAIEICELQKNECAEQFENIFISLGKNVAE